MKQYLGEKMIKASEEMSRKEYCDYRGWELPENENGDDRVYIVESNSKPNHPKHEGYISMSPKDVFEKTYRETDGLTFGLAIEALKLCKCIARKGWNGKGMFVCKQVPSVIGQDIVPKMQSLPQSAKDQFTQRWHNANAENDAVAIANTGSIEYHNQMIIVKPDNSIDSWVASSSDTFAEDWVIL